MKRFYLTGQRTFGNRGCEAIVRSTVSVLRDTHGNIEVLVPSDDIARDSAQWPDAKDYGVTFVPAYQPKYTRYWIHAQRLPLPFLKRAGWPFPIARWFKEQIESVDAVLSIGGDNYSLDYRLPSLLQGMDACAMDMGKPVVIWGASVGPFERETYFVPAIRNHIARFEKVMVRESISFSYLTEKLGLDNVEQMVDPAFILKAEALDLVDFWPEHQADSGVLGLNVSPLIERYKRKNQNLVTEVAAFVRRLVEERGFGVLLVPHVIPLDGSEKNNDAIYLKQILSQCADLGKKVTIAPSASNAAQLKYIISKVRFFIGARTHATIAALSSTVPTVSISYSVKARGINWDLFGSEEMVLPTPELTCESLSEKMDYLLSNESWLRKTLAGRIPEYQSTVQQASLCLKVPE